MMLFQGGRWGEANAIWVAFKVTQIGIVKLFGIWTPYSIETRIKGRDLLNQRLKVFLVLAPVSNRCFQEAHKEREHASLN